MRIIVVGAGIGGATLALALERAGLDYVVLEQAPALTEVGAGIQLSPNGVRVLDWLGLADDLAEFCVEPGAHQFKEWDSGENVLSTPLMPMARDRFGAPYYHAHRADLIAALAGRLNPARLRLGAEVVAVGQDGAGVTAELAAGGRERGDVLIGADGIHSLVRNRVFNPGRPRPSGYLAWRGVVPADAAADLDIGRYSFVVMGPRLSAVFYYISGGRLINWIAIGPAEDEKRESWSQTADGAELRAAFEGWYPQPRGLVELTEDVFVTALHDRDPLPNWVDGRIAVMGDAAHAMLPYHAQGAVQGIEDAWVLARTLQLHGDDDPAAALRRYEALRKHRAQRLQQHSRNAERWYHLDDADEVAHRDARFRRHAEDNPDGFTKQQVWLYAYDAEQAALGTDDDWRALPDW
ncbi:MAG: FAD-dependent monooxygenase [Alphaproteobacteria bacterium]|jgi:salicylate hydroxylase|nr:FAD-dependent monooxygenase [Alphaproteobacteria bacterium]MDP6567905.1 FAD-dependent monooxygenase [Alphaproteobacteria bacterium]MDP6812412.1 FAD-dependent monooxygenase [Alphaproteobacteria bacterium]